MKYFLVVQDSLTDKEPTLEGPFNTIASAKNEASNHDSPDAGWIFTVLAQDGSKFRQVEQAIVPENFLVWQPSK